MRRFNPINSLLFAFLILFIISGCEETPEQYRGKFLSSDRSVRLSLRDTSARISSEKWNFKVEGVYLDFDSIFKNLNQARDGIYITPALRASNVANPNDNLVPPYLPHMRNFALLEQQEDKTLRDIFIVKFLENSCTETNLFLRLKECLATVIHTRVDSSQPKVNELLVSITEEASVSTLEIIAQDSVAQITDQWTIGTQEDVTVLLKQEN